MASKNIDEYHPSLASSYEVSNIIMPWVRSHGITVFNYYRIYFDNRVIRLSSETEWTRHYFEKNYLKTLSIPADYIANELNYYLWRIEDCPDMLADSAQNFNIANGISIAVKHDDHIEYFCFATELHNTSIINTFYLNNLDKLLQYAQQFQSQAEVLIKQSLENPLMIEHQPQDIILPTASVPPPLSKRQQEIAELLLQGLRYKEIAYKLQLSTRTIEYYVGHLKDKFACKTKSQLLLSLSQFN